MAPRLETTMRHLDLRRKRRYRCTDANSGVSLPCVSIPMRELSDASAYRCFLHASSIAMREHSES